jgi:hypothetical protein
MKNEYLPVLLLELLSVIKVPFMSGHIMNRLDKKFFFFLFLQQIYPPYILYYYTRVYIYIYISLPSDRVDCFVEGAISIRTRDFSCCSPMVLSTKIKEFT